MLKVTNPGGETRAKLFMAPNPKPNFRKENRNKKIISPIKQTALLCTCVQETGWTRGVLREKQELNRLFTYTVQGIFSHCYLNSLQSSAYINKNIVCLITKSFKKAAK